MPYKTAEFDKNKQELNVHISDDQNVILLNTVEYKMSYYTQKINNFEYMKTLNKLMTKKCMKNGYVFHKKIKNFAYHNSFIM